jgi:AraC-like DNA-binding protein
VEALISQAGHVRSPRQGGPRILYAWPTVQVGAFDCWPGDARWRQENHVDEGHLIAFPGTAVEIAQHGHRPLIADPSRVVLYNRHQSYRRGLVDRAGDHCTFLVVSPTLLEEVAARSGAAVRDPERRPFGRPTIDVSPVDHLEHRALLQVVRREEPTQQLELQERLALLVERILSRRSARSGHRPRRPRAATEREHDRIVESARAILAADLAQPMGLDEVADRAGASVFHLSRVFRERTGRSLHAYRDQLRLRTAVERVLDGSRRLTDVALELGYASHSHFTDRFCAAYGFAPSQLRLRARRGARF